MVTHLLGRSRNGKPLAGRKTAKDRVRRSLKRVAQWCWWHLHDDPRVQQKVLTKKLRGHYVYFGIVGNYSAKAPRAPEAAEHQSQVSSSEAVI